MAYWQEKPPYGTPIDGGRSLAASLRGFYAINERAGPNLYDATRMGPSLSFNGFGSNDPWGSGVVGPAADLTVASGVQVAGPLPAALQVGWPISGAVAINIPAALNSAYTYEFWGLYWDNAGSFPFYVSAIEASGGTIHLLYNTGGTFHDVDTAVPLAGPGDYVLSWTMTPTSQAVYVNGQAAWSASASLTNPQYGTGPSLILGNRYGYSGWVGSSFKVHWAAWWNGALGAGRHASMGAGPAAVFDQVFARPKAKFLNAVPPATAYTLTAPSPAQGVVNAASGNFTVALNGLPSGTVTVTVTPSGGGLSTPITLGFSGSTTTRTFAITPTATGTVALTPTNDGGLTNPSAVTYQSLAAATAYTLTAPSPAKGDVTVVSGNFTVTLNGAPAGTIVVTPHSSAAGGYTFTPSTLSFSGTTTTGTFTYAGSLFGTDAISCTNNGGLTDPASVSYLSMVQLGSSGTASSGNRCPSLGGFSFFRPRAAAGTVSATHGGTTLTTTATDPVFPRLFVTIDGDSSNGRYTITGGSGTSFAISPAYGGSTVSGATWKITCPWWSEFARDITGDMVDAQSSGYVGQFPAGDRLKVDFSATGAGGQNGLYGMPVNVVAGTTGDVTITVANYPTFSDAGPAPFSNSDSIEGIAPGSSPPTTEPSGDGHDLIGVRNETTGLLDTLWESWKTWTTTGGTTFTVAQLSKWDLTKPYPRPDAWTSADAAGLPIFPLLTRYDEADLVVRGLIPSIGHALRGTVNSTYNVTWPGKHIANSAQAAYPVGLPLGARLRLSQAWFDANYSSFTGHAAPIVYALRHFGLINADTYGGGVAFSLEGVSDDRWAASELALIAGIPVTAFEVIPFVPPWTWSGATTGLTGVPSAVTIARNPPYDQNYGDFQQGVNQGSDTGFIYLSADAGSTLDTGGVLITDNLTIGAPSQTFHITATTTGPHVVTPNEDGQNWIGPTFTFTASAPDTSWIGSFGSINVNFAAGATGPSWAVTVTRLSDSANLSGTSSFDATHAVGTFTLASGTYFMPGTKYQVHFSGASIGGTPISGTFVFDPATRSTTRWYGGLSRRRMG